MRKNCGCVNPCGCGDYVMDQAPNCSTTCSGGEDCYDIFDGACVAYTGDTLLNINIQKGERLNDVIQKLVGAITNPGCNYPDSPCQSVVVKSVNVGSSTVKVSWGLVDPGSPTYQVQYRLPSDPNWTLNSAVTATTTSDLIGGLTPNTTYYVRVATLCSSACYSVTLIIKTKTS